MSTEHLSHGHSANGRPVHSDVAYEKTDVHTGPILRFLFYLGVLVVLTYVVTVGIYKGLTDFWATSYTPPIPSAVDNKATLPPEPRMQGMPGHLNDPQQDMREKVKADNEANSKFGWVDQKAGIAQIPVSDAMQLIVEKGLPAVSPQAAEKK
jgi:hypothetical protein